MKIQVRIGILLFVLVACAPSQAQNFAYSQNQKLGRGVNLGNALEAPNEGEWGVTLKESYFEMIANKGFHSVRIPIRWSNHAQINAPYTIDSAFFERIDWAVQCALKNKLMVIIDCHHYNEMFSSPASHLTRFLTLWNQISHRYAGYSDSLVFEPLNEPNTNLTAELWNSYFTRVLDTIRKTNAQRTVLVGLAEWGGASAISKLVLPADTNLILTVHYYNPYHFTHQGADWAEGSEAWLGTGWYNTESERKAVVNDFKPIKAFSIAHHIPVHVGEFGAYSEADMDSRARWTNFCARYFEEQRFSWAYWEFCSGFGIYNPDAGTWYSQLVSALLTKPMPDPFSDPSGNMIFNGDFTYGITNWEKYTDATGAATFTVSGKTAKISITNGGAQTWYVQLYNAGFTLVKGKKYALEFDAYASKSRSMNAGVAQSSSPYTTYYSKDAPLSVNKAHYDLEFTMSHATDSSARVLFNLGANTGNIYIQNVFLREVIPTGTEDPQTALVPIIYPVPASEHFTIEYPGMHEIALYNLVGKLIYSKTGIETPALTVQSSDWPRGIYLLRLRDQDGALHNLKVILE